MTAVHKIANMTDRIGPNPGPQTAFVGCPVDDVFYGGARGGGKTYGLILDWLVHAQKWGALAFGIIFRKSFPELAEVQKTCRMILPGLGWTYHGGNREWTSPDGATLKLRFLKKDADADLYQGHSYTWMAFDEAGNWSSPDALDELLAALRSAHGVPCLRRFSGNPGGVGHNWLKQRFVDPAAPMQCHEEAIRLKDGTYKIRTTVFIPAKLSDNPQLSATDYEANLWKTGKPWLVKAWLEGDWDIVAGGFFDDLWRREVHAIKPFEIPTQWRMDRSFDWGSARPFSVGWWAECNGGEAPNGKTYPKGSIIRIGEWYGWDGTANVGCGKSSADIAKGIKAAEKKWGWDKRVYPGPADPSIWTETDANSIAKGMKAEGVTWTKGINKPGSRVSRWQICRDMLEEALKPKPEKPILLIFDTCTDGFIRTFPTLQRDQKKLDDIDTDQEDHCADEVGYRVLHKKKVWKTQRVPV